MTMLTTEAVAKLLETGYVAIRPGVDCHNPLNTDLSLAVWELGYRAAISRDKLADIDLRLADACRPTMSFVEYIGLGETG